MTSPKALRLDRLLANLGYGSRKDIAAMVRAGNIRLDGERLRRADVKVTVEDDLPLRMTVAGEALDPPPGMAIMMHKPLGVTCSHKEAGQRVYDLLPERFRIRTPQISTIGRLDKDTSGLLLLTDDGDFLHKVISPRSNVPKRYRAMLARPLNGGEAERFASGTLMLEGEVKPLLPAELQPLSETEALLTLHEGRYHQVRRMFAALGNHVEALHREAIGAMALPADLEPGHWRLMTEDDRRAVLGA